LYNKINNYNSSNWVKFTISSGIEPLNFEYSFDEAFVSLCPIFLFIIQELLNQYRILKFNISYYNKYYFI